MTLTGKALLCLMRNLRVKFGQLKNLSNESYKFESYVESYFAKLGFDFYGKKQHRLSPSIQIKIENAQEKEKFIKEFAKYNPKSVFDPLTKTNTIQMPGRFLKHLYGNYYKSSEFKPIKNLTQLQERKLQLSQLLQQIERSNLNKNLTSARKLALDYDNTDFYIIEACSTYAISLKIYAELYKEALSKKDYQLFYAASHLLAAYDRNGQLKQSLISDSLFISYLQEDLYQNGLTPKHYESKKYPLVADLQKDKAEEIFNAINENIENLLYGNAKTQANKSTYFVAQRFLPDSNNFSDTDEIVFQAGGRRGHSAFFRLIKVPMLKNGQKAESHENPAYFDYFKIENNLGAGCNQPEFSTNICSGTYVTKIQPYTRNSAQNWILAPYDPLTNPQEYQKAIEETLKEIIKIERLLLFYLEPSLIKDSQRYCSFSSKEGQEWSRLNQLKQLLKGIPHQERLFYSVKDVLNPACNYECAVENQKGYMQEGGSCAVFSMKSLGNSILNQELTTLHNHFMQQHDAWDCITALGKSITKNNQQIETLSPLFIVSSRRNIQIWENAFKTFLQAGKNKINGLEVSHSKNPDLSTLILRQPYLKKKWSIFITIWQAEKENMAVANPNCFFEKNQTFPPITNVQIVKPWSL